MFTFSETNPHFGPQRNEDERSPFQDRQARDQDNPPPKFPRERSRPSSHRHFTPPPPVPGVPSQLPQPPRFPRERSPPSPHQHFSPPPPIPGVPSLVPRPQKKNKRQEPRDSERQQLIGPRHALVPEDQNQHADPRSHGTQPTDPRDLLPRPQKLQPQRQPQDQVTQQKERQHPESPAVLQSPLHDQHPRHRHQHLLLPPLRRTKLITWFLAGVSAIFWIVIILGGLIVLIIYLVFRPHSPSFQVSSVTLNAAYLDVDVLLNADLTLLAKFINPNKKVRVDFSHVVLELYHGNTMIASQYVEPFRAERLETRLATVHMVSSQVRLPLEETVRLRREIEGNAIVFQVKGVFRARSSLGSFLRYSYRLYGHCTIMVSNPPTGVIKAIKCRTKR